MKSELIGILHSTSKMGLLGALGLSVALLTLTQIRTCSAEGCHILSSRAESSSSIQVKWQQYVGATNYFLDLRMKNNSKVAPVVVTLPATYTEKSVYGLRPGTEYSVTLKVFQFYFVLCMDRDEALTVPDTAQITAGRGMSSTSLTLEWSEVASADYYYLLVISQTTGETLNKTFTNTTKAEVTHLQPSTNYDCYVYTANRAGMGSSSKVRTITTLVVPPTGVKATSAGRGEVMVTWLPVEDVLLYRVALQILDDPSSPPTYHETSDTELEVGGILPCSTYLISVSSFNTFLVPSEPTDLTYTTNKLTPVASVTVDYVCTTHSAVVHWTTVFGAESYKAVAYGENGTELMCTSQQKSCEISGLSCGQNYEVHVTPMSESCTHMLNTTWSTFQTVPCPPKKLDLQRECSSEVIVFSWEHTNNTDHYMARAVDSQGVVQECMTEDNSCYFTHTVCGRHYSFTVYSIAGQCRSQTSSTVDIRTAPCIPQNLQTSADCSSDVLLSKWDLAEGALHYVVEAFGNKGANTKYNCSSMSNSCAIQGVQCGEYLTIYITAYDNDCSSPRTLGPVAETVPCAPRNVTAVKECGADAITLTWTSESAIFYVAMATDSNGIVHSCNSLDMMCRIDGLKCSTNYTAYVMASNFMCNSSESEMVTIETAACPPDHVTAALDCSANEALISWYGEPKMNSYTASIVDEDQGLLSCSSTNTSCSIPNLKCGQLYTVTVSHHDGMCPSMPSDAIYMESVPCGPKVKTDMDCESGELTVGWNRTSEAEGYMTEVTYGDRKMTYNTTEPVLQIHPLMCGLDYTLRVMSFNSSCLSQPTVVSAGQTPCVPTNVTASRNCGQSFVDVTWEASRGALSYKAAAADKDGSRLMCSSYGTSCRLEGLMCSRVYNVTVSAMNHECSSQESEVETLQTAPCPPTQLNVSLNCANDSAMLTWNSSPNAAWYGGKAVQTDGSHTLTCDAGVKLGCRLDGLNCGQKYTFTVSASDGSCQSPDSEPVELTTAPCAVQDVRNTMNCSTNSLTVSWQPGSTPANYSATALAGDGTALKCVTEDSKCLIADLQCGQQYNVTVKALSSMCDGHSSVSETVHAVPCVPMQVEAHVDCATNVLQAHWDSSAGASSYVSMLKGPGGFYSSHTSPGEGHVFSRLLCAQTYMFSVMAANDRCNSSHSAVMSATTAPCDPTNLTADLNCLSGSVTVTWDQSGGATRYTVIAEANGHEDSCESNGRSCDLTRLRCGEDYSVTVLAGDGRCNSSVLAKTSVTTAPCAPVVQDHTLDCVSNHGLISWIYDEDAAVVMVNATSSLGHSTSCSSSTNSSCVLDLLMCGHTYTVQAVARGDRCLSKPSSSFQIITAPCTPANVEFTYTCESGIAFLSWDETPGRESFYTEVNSEDHMETCDTRQTDCSLSSLLCSHMYHVKVIAVAEHCNSSRPGEVWIQTAPCAPLNISSSLVCENNTAAVSWQPSFGAISYKVLAKGRDGDVKQCITNDTYCYLPSMHCALAYIITVMPYSQHCKGSESEPHTHISGPCPPTDVHVSLQCLGNVGHVTWDAALLADRYVATASPSAADGREHTCSSNGTGCSLTDLRCGEAAAVTVVTIERGCMSAPSSPYIFQTVICPPTGVSGVPTCMNNDITVSWDQSPESGVDYFIKTQEGSGAVANFSTTQTSHVLSGLQCGEIYTLHVAAKNAECTSEFSPNIQTETAPCPPTNLTVRPECGTNLGNLTWSPSVHAISYTVTVAGTHGHVASCSSNTTSCSVKLDCGRHYSAFIVASSATCNSSRGETITFDSAPCLPDDVRADLDCKANTFAVKWRASVGDVTSYTALAIGSDDSRAMCNSTTTNCTIHSLKCGLNYSIVVTTASVDCGTIEGSDYTMMSAPCKPEAVSLNLTCSTDVALVSWSNSGPDQMHVVSAVNSRGKVTVCNSTSSNCTFDTLTCGQSYAVSVVGHTDTCSSDPAMAERLNTAPCAPTHPSAHADCETGITSVTWDSSPGATSYTVYAWGNLGHNATCDNSDTNCNFVSLPCGQDYEITVVARHDSCVSAASVTTNVTTGPCPHTALKTYLDCDTNTAMVSWTPGSGILYYNASADGFDVDHMQTCSTNGSSCNISSLTCGESYRVTVSGQGRRCLSPAKDWYRVNTAPCPPTELTVDSSCNSNDISVSWQSSQGSFSYMGVAENEAGERWSCNTSRISCQISSLPCGQKFEVYAVGVDAECTGTKSDVKVIHTAPCVPENIHKHLDCLSGDLNVTWESTGHFARFHASAMSSDGHVSVCETNQHYCVLPSMHCGLMYNVTVWAEDETCNSSFSPKMKVVTAPCPLPSFAPTIDCSTGVLSVTWSDGVAGVDYTVSAVAAAGRRHNCSSMTGGCDVTTLECSTKYNVTITPSTNGCVGGDSRTQMIMTVPCVPHISDVEIDCLANSAWVMYDEAPEVEHFYVTAMDQTGVNQTFGCNSTSDRTCSLPPFPCSQNITFTLEAYDQQCTSMPSNAVTTETAPCAPVGVQRSVGCHNNTVSVTWPPVPGAVSYHATLEQLNGNTTCCSSSGGGCDITGLPCGGMYNLMVTVEGRTCNSSESDEIFVITEPCVPQDLRADLSCSDNVAHMSWNQSGLGQYYTVRAVGEDGHEDSCSTSGNKCDLTGLTCGQFYTATVTAENIECESKPSEGVEIKTVPCTPANVSSEMDCETNALVVTWSNSPGADSYIATLRDSNGQTTTCLGTSEGSCNVTGVGCGLIYRVSVVASDGYCDSPATERIHVASAPCKASNIEAELDCFEETAVVSWYPSDGASMYTVTAHAESGQNVSCEANSTHCELDGLLCGQRYSVCVTAVGETCSCVTHMTGTLVTAPCTPEHISVQYSLSIGQVLWDSAAGAESYEVEGVTEHGLMVSCVTNDTNCALYSMNCGQVYSINVTANNHVCRGVSTSTEPAAIMTEPCPPNNIQADMMCQANMGKVSWEASYGAVGYEVNLAGRDGHSLSCYTTDTYCDLEGLHCSVIYYTTVVAVGEKLNSSVSTTVLLGAAPCPAADVGASLDCDNDTAEVWWSAVDGAVEYVVVAMGTYGHVVSCETDEVMCELTALQCGDTYNVSITSVSERCRTEKRANVSISTGPCKPVRVGVDLRCGTRTAELHWEESEDVEMYMTTATCGMGTSLTCNSTNSTCYFPDLKCGETYEFSVTAYNGMCSSEISSSVEIHTEPCQPVGLTVSGSCYNETVYVDWSAADGALMYILMVEGDLGYITSYQTNETWIEAQLPCGQLFTFSVTAQDDRCESPVSLKETFKTGPCVPQHVESFTPCENNTGSASWARSDGAESYMAIAVGLDGHTHVCLTNSTVCTWDDLHCGEMYTIHVVANDYLCSSMPSNSTSIHMAPCIPQNLESSLNCTYKFGSLSWDPVETAQYYLVKAESLNSEHKVQLSTNDSWTFISEFQCGEEYSLSVQAADSQCTSLPSQTSRLHSVPCPPTGVSSSMNCLANIAVVSWTRSSGGQYYTAVVTQEDGETMSCSSDGEECGMPNLNCGQNYAVQVIASNGKCDSDLSEGDMLQSVPCIPTDVDVEVDCSTNQAVVHWAASDGALSFKAAAQGLGGVVSVCESSNLTCTLTDLICGEFYSVQVVAQDEICSSLPSQAVTFKSVPCTPAIGSVVLDCYTNSALLDWSFAEGAENYTATARSPSGHVSTCTSNFTNCELLGLECGWTYDVTTVASNEICSSPPSSRLQVDSVPCPPEDVMPVLDCSTGSALVGWQSSRGSLSYYVHAVGVEEHETSCETDSDSCVLPDLLCGFTYNISVLAVNSICNVSYSQMKQLHAVPCVPQHVEARVVCESGAVAVSWEPSKGATRYTTVAYGNGGYASTCNSTITTCLFSDLMCSFNYSISVSAADDMCSSAESPAEELSTVPCVPQKVDAEMICGNDTGVVWWEEEDGVSSYMVRAFGPDGHRTECSSTETSCHLPSMHCGQLYNLTVTAEDGRCDNSNAYLYLQSVPCSPTNVKAALRCHSNSGAVTWERASGAVDYHAVGVSADSLHYAECNNTMTHCDLKDLQCGQTYNVSVYGLDGFCSSVESDVVHMQTAPCAPQNVSIQAQCADGAFVVSWSPNPDAQHFHVAAVSSRGARLFCNSSSTSCSISNLPCGQTYNVTVFAVRDGCESELSAVVQTSSAPCVPRNPEGNLDCVSNSAWVRWADTDGALSYYVQATGVGGHTANCSSSSSPCNVPDLNCGTLYTFYLTAVNKHCSSKNSSTFQLETGPCALTSISAVTQCGSDTIQVQWEMTADTPVYLVTAEGHDQSYLSCNSSSDRCELQDARCGMHYSIIVSASSDKCSSLRSPPKKIKTAPCVPENVTVNPSCEKNGAAVTWGHSDVATSYMLTATGRDGHQVSCSTAVNNCTLMDLHCGQPYSLNVTARGENCSSPPSMSTFRTVPCAPSGLDVDLDCETSSALLTWDASEGAVEYFGCARPLEGDALYCDSTGLSCSIQGLECGGVYNFSVEASDGVCNSSFSTPVQEGAAPCPPADVGVRIQRIRQTHWAMVSWEPVDCPDVEYLVKINGWIQNDPQAQMELMSYWLPRSYYEFPMLCSTSYNLTVQSRNPVAVSEPSTVFTGVTVPCAPQNVMFRGSTQAAVLSWDPSVFATMYTVYDVSGEGRVELCHTSELSCSLVNFDPFNTIVTASNQEGESNASQNITGPVDSRRRRDLRTTKVYAHLDGGLEVPELLEFKVSGVSVSLTWMKVKEGTTYILLIEEQQSEQQSEPRLITVEGDSHTETDLKPLTTYSIRLSAKNAVSQSQFSRPVNIKTGSS